MIARRTARYECLDAWRGLAILAVMMLHFCEPGLRSGDALVHARVWTLASHGYLGVQLFFVISGYCITAALDTMLAKPRAIQRFLQRRVRRIFPPYWASLVLVVGTGIITCVLAHKSWHEIFPQSVGDWGLNLALFQEPFAAPAPNLVYWSLSIEIQFYLVMALCLLKGEWAEPLLILVSAASMCVLSFTRYSLSGTVFAYWAQFACGIAAYYLITGRRQWVFTPWCILLTVGVTALSGVWQHPALLEADGRLSLSLKLAFCLVAAFLLVGLYAYDERLTRSRWIRGFSAFGVISYSLYLTHVPVGTRIFNLGERLTGLQGRWWAAYAVIAFLLATAFGAVFYRYCERPWLNTESRRVPVPEPVAAPIAALEGVHE